jgi:hypothetical protein
MSSSWSSYQYRSCYWLALGGKVGSDVVEKHGIASVRSGSHPAPVGYSSAVCFAMLYRTGGRKRKWEVKGGSVAGDLSLPCGDEEPHATPHFPDATSPLGSWPKRPLCLVILFFRLLFCSVNSKQVYCNCTSTKAVYHQHPIIPPTPSPAAAYQHTPQTQSHPHRTHPAQPSPHSQDSPSAASSQPS